MYKHYQSSIGTNSYAEVLEMMYFFNKILIEKDGNTILDVPNLKLITNLRIAAETFSGRRKP